MSLFETLQKEKILALKSKQELRKCVLNEAIDACQKAQINATKNGVKPELTDEFCKPVLQKYQKTIEEMVDTCPASRTELLEKYQTQLAIVREFVPQAITDPFKIADIITNTGFAVTDKKNLMPALKAAGVDMKVAQTVLMNINMYK